MNRIKKMHAHMATSHRVGLTALLLSLVMFASAASANEANLTRFGPKIDQAERGAPATMNASSWPN